ncbi:MAG: SDR family NAD(P)-dependent oxidoreductase [Phormidesmis sp. RL_2_1]|nr:SDR family NAD(P)-dependent oxidoreductase [Phormidesmis sp. RL_2_1]
MPSPAALEKSLQTLLNERATRANLAYFRQQAQVDYRAVDVADGAAFSALIQDIYHRYGRLDGVIHGAGLIADKLLIDKLPASFAQVFDTKADSAFTLMRELRPDSLKLMVFFSSVAGRYGSRGQSDYAAANEVVNRLAWQMHWRCPQTRVVSINWGPWDTAGMASEGVKRQFRERGIIPISQQAGCEFFTKNCSMARSVKSKSLLEKGPGQRSIRSSCRKCDQNLRPKARCRLFNRYLSSSPTAK